MRVVPPSRAEVVGALGLFRRRGWVLALLGVVALSVLFVLLGRWQYHRHEAKADRRDRVAANYDAAPVPLPQVLPDDVLAGPGAALAVDDEWRAVTATGSYLPAQTLLVRNRTLDGANGYEVLVPLRVDGPTSGLLVVDRGWVPSGTDARAPDAVPDPPAGPVTVTVRLRVPEPAGGRRPPAGQVQRIDLTSIARTYASQGLTGPLYPAYGVLAAEDPAARSAPTPLPRPDTGLGVNLAYAVQWYGFALTAYVLLGVAAVREVRRVDAAPTGAVATAAAGEP